MPISLAYLAAYLRTKGHTVQVIDAFGENPHKITIHGNYYRQGLTIPEIIEKIQTTDHFFTYAGQVVSHNSHLDIIRAIREKHPQIPITIVENTQSVNAYSIATMAQEFFDAGATHLSTGEAEIRAEELLAGKPLKNIDGLVYKKNSKIIHQKKTRYLTNQQLDELPFPAWDLFPIKNYWKLGYAHGPLTNKKYLSILTSRGCGLLCKFCVVPETNEGKWRSRSPANVVDELEHWVKKYNVHEFHFQDLNATTYKVRMQQIADEILRRNLHISWKFVAGTKIETMTEETLTTMAQAGCNYVSISPESGSAHVLKLMGKSFIHDYALRMIKHMHKLNITTQACFVLGFPGETNEDLDLTEHYCKQLAKAGIDELALFIMTPIPGSATYGQITGFKDLEQLTFSPTWRTDFAILQQRRWNIYKKFLFWKLRWHPIKLLKQPLNVLTGRFQTKMEQTTYHALKLKWLVRKAAQT